jgi:Tfp pilus assembly protein PilF
MIAVFQKDYRTAERYFEEAHLQAPENFQASNDFALALAEQKDDVKRRRARQYAEDNLRKYPKVAQALSTYGWVAYKLDQMDEAEGALRAAISSAGAGAETAYYLAQVDVARKRYPEAKLLLARALKEPGPFAMRAEAKALLEQIEKAPGDSAPAEKAPFNKK